MYLVNETIYFRHESGSRALKGEVIGHVDGMYQVKGMRSATQHARPVYLIPAEQVFPVEQIKRKPHTHKLQGSGLSLNTTESLERKQITENRLNMTEGQILQCRAMIDLKRRIVLAAAHKNNIPYRSLDYNELESEFMVAALGAIRAAVSKATSEELNKFLSFLAGNEEHFFCRIVMNIARTGKTACIRFLKRRQQYHTTYINIDALERREAA